MHKSILSKSHQSSKERPFHIGYLEYKNLKTSREIYYKWMIHIGTKTKINQALDLLISDDTVLYFSLGNSM